MPYKINKTINISGETYDFLSSWKDKKESWNDFLRELMLFWEQEHQTEQKK